MLRKILSVSMIVFTLGSMIGCGSNSEPLAELTSVTGNVECKLINTNTFKDASKGLTLFENSSVRTKENGQATLSFKKGGTLKLSANSFFEVKKGNILGKQTKGTGIYKINKQSENLSIETPQGLTTILGTEFRQDINDNSTVVTLKKGSIQFTDNAGKKVTIKPEERIVIEKGKALPKPQTVNSFDIDSLFSEGKAIKSF